MITIDCVDPDAVQTWELEAYADGENLPHVAEHLERCPACRTQVAGYRALEQKLGQLLYRSDCPPPDQLRMYHDDELSAEEKSRIKEHLIVCPHCALELENLIRALAIESSVSWREEMKQALQSGQQSGLSMAHLVEPAPQSPPALRGETQEVLLFEVGELVLSLNLEQDEVGAYTLFGQLLSSTPIQVSENYARLRASYSASPTVEKAPLDANGSFVLPNLSPGIYQLVVDIPGLHIVVPDLTLREAF